MANLFSTASRPTLGPFQPPIQWVSGAISSGIKRPEREANQSPPCSAEVKNGRAVPPLPIYRNGLVHRDNFTFTLRGILWKAVDWIRLFKDGL
jgi:hypothetical protein